MDGVDTPLFPFRSIAPLPALRLTHLQQETSVSHTIGLIFTAFIYESKRSEPLFCNCCAAYCPTDLILRSYVLFIYISLEDYNRGLCLKEAFNSLVPKFSGKLPGKEWLNVIELEDTVIHL